MKNPTFAPTSTILEILSPNFTKEILVVNKYFLKKFCLIIR